MRRGLQLNFSLDMHFELRQPAAHPRQLLTIFVNQDADGLPLMAGSAAVKIVTSSVASAFTR